MKTMLPPRFLRLHAADNLLIALDLLAPGSALEPGVVASERIMRGHKVAACAIPQGTTLRKFGQIIGVATSDIAAGAHVHSHNLGMPPQQNSGEYADFTQDDARDGRQDTAPDTGAESAQALPVPAFFEGFLRADGKVGTRNYLAILTSVNCSASLARFIAEAASKLGLLENFPNIDGIIPLTHSGGCGLDTQGEGYEILQRTQWGYATNPNIGAVLMVGLGCEGFQIARWKERYGIVESERFRSLILQESGGTKQSITKGLEFVRAMLPALDSVCRTPQSAAHLTLGLQCGGSDGYSALTANPALGLAADRLIAAGGTAILSETPEVYGAEHLLYAKASPQIRAALRARLVWWEAYTKRNAMEMNNNPSPGNKLGGLTTILEKSLGAVAKAGSTPLKAVYEYAEIVHENGLVFMDTPGYDPVSATGQVAGGANLLAFTTGRGSAFGCKPTPSLKLATHSALFQAMPDDMDINCGDILEGVSLEDKGLEIFNKLLRVASGEPTKSETLGYGEAEFIPWQIGAVM